MKLKSRILSSRMRGDDVALLHEELSLIGYEIPEDEVRKKMFGKATRRVVLEFQSRHKLKKTGVVDEATVSTLNEIISKKEAAHVENDVKPKLKDTSVFVKPGILFGNLTDLTALERNQADFVNSKLNEKLKGEIIRRVGTISDELTDALRNKIAKIDYRKIQDSELTYVIRDLVSEVKKEGLEKEVAQLENCIKNVPTIKIRDLLFLDVPLMKNPIFANELRKGKTLEYAKLANINSKKAEKLAEKNIDLKKIGEPGLKRLVEDKEIAEREKNELWLVVSLAKLTGDNIELMKSLKTDELKSTADLVNWREADWLNLIENEKIPLPPGETKETYADKILYNIEKSYPSETLITRILNPEIITQFDRLDSVNKLLKNNDVLIDSRNQLTLDWRGIGKEKRKEIKKELQNLREFANTYRHLDILDLINDKDLDISSKKKAISERLKYLETFFENNSDLDFRYVDLIRIEEKKLDWKGIPLDIRPLIKKQLRAYQRVSSFTIDIDSQMKLLGNGYDSARSIINQTRADFVKTSGLSVGKSEMTYAIAREYTEYVALNYGTIRDTLNGQFKSISMSNLDPTIVNDLKDIDGFDDLFGPQNFCDCEHCKSILSPAAYFVDLMYFIEKNVSNQTFQDKPDHPLYLKNRRRDLWELKLTCENTNTLVPYLTIVNEVLENYLNRVINANIFEEMSFRNNKISFLLPFNLPLEELRIFLEHFETSLHEIYRILKQADEKIWRERIHISKEELDTISSKDISGVKYRFGNPDSFDEFDVQDFIRIVGIDRKQLDELLSSVFNPDLANIEIIIQSTDDLQDYEEYLENLTLTRLDFVHRFVKLWKKLKWSISELDLILNALKKSNLITKLDNTAIAFVAKLVDLQNKLDLTVEELCSMFHTIPACAEPPKNELEKKLFERLFDTKKLFGENDYSTSFHYREFNEENPDDKEIDPKTPILLAGLRISETDLELMFKLLKSQFEFDPTNPDNGTFKLDLEKISMIYRHVRLAKALKMDTENFIQALNLNFESANSVITSLEGIFQLYEFRKWQKTSPFTVSELRFIIGGEESSTVEYKSTMDSVATIILETQNDPEDDKIDVLRKQLMNLFNITSKQLENILKWVSIPIDSDIIRTALESSITDGSPDNPDDINGLFSLIKEIERLLLLFSNLKFNEESVTFLTENPGIFGISNLKQLKLYDIIKFSSYQHFITLNEDVQYSIEDILTDHHETNSFSEESINSLAAILKTDRSMIESLMDCLDLPDLPIECIEYIEECLELCESLGINGFSLLKLIGDSDYNELLTARDVVFGSLNSKYDDEKTSKEKLEPYIDKINELKRDALCDYIISLKKELKFKDLNEVYSFFLLDVEIGGCFRTSRLVCAISSLQLYIHRCLINLEQSDPYLNPEIVDVKVDPRLIPSDEWEWRKNYRVWEANRKIFLYPENYVLPDLRDNKTPLFLELEEELLQQKISLESAEAAYRRYLAQFSKLTRLKIAGSYYHEESKTYYLFGCTQENPPQYYYRKWINNMHWTPWEHIELGIDSDMVSAIIHMGKLFIFWLKIDDRQQSSIRDGDSYTTYSSEKLLRYSYLTEQGTWTPIQEIDLEQPIRKYSPFHHSNIVYPIVHNNEIYINHPCYLCESTLCGIFKKVDFFKNQIRNVGNEDPNRLIPANSELIKPIAKSGQVYLGICNNPYELSESELEFQQSVFYYYSPLDNSQGKILTTDVLAQNPELHIVSHKLGDYIFKLGNQQYLIQNHGESKPPPSYNHFWVKSAYPTYRSSQVPVFVSKKKSSPSNNPSNTGSSSLDFAYSTSPYLTSTFTENLYASATQTLSGIELAHIGQYEMYRISTSVAETLAEILYNQGLQQFLSIETQKTHERPIEMTILDTQILAPPYDDPDHLDFKGSYGIYYKELFFHIPFLIASHLNANQKFKEAKWWYERIFNPTAYESPYDTRPTDRNWKYIEFKDLSIQKMKEILTDNSAILLYKTDPFNPHAIARLRMNAYQKSIVMKYIDNLIDWGDFLFAQDTMESINEAMMLYILASDILGERPVEIGECKTAKDEELTYEVIGKEIEEGSEFLITLENWIMVNSNSTETQSDSESSIDSQNNLRDYSDVSEEMENNASQIEEWKNEESNGLSPSQDFVQSIPVFCIPQNKILLEYWDRVEDRLFKIRNCMSITGVRRQIALFQPPIDPMMLVRAKAAGLSLETIMEMITPALPSYRFTYLIEKAKQMVQMVQNYGATLLSALEKRDVEELTLLKSVHERNILRLTRQIKKQQVKEAQYQLQSIIETKSNIQNKIDYYAELIDVGLTGWERTQQITKHVATGLKTVEGLIKLNAAIIYLIPQVGSPFAMKYGGKEIGDSMSAWSQWLSSMASVLESVSASAALEAGFQRREQEWEQQLKLAEQELIQVEQQQLAAEIGAYIAEKDLTVHEKTMDQTDEVYNLYKNKFTNLGLYDYLSTDLNRLYREAYNVAYDIAKMAEKAYKFERDDDTDFIATDNWQYDRTGLLAGERLNLQLQQMEKSYMEKYKRDNEITQCFSLAFLNPLELEKLKQNGCCEFQIPEIAYDLTYPGHYKRIVKSVRITIPCVTGPYTNINAKLTLINSKIREKPESELDNVINQKFASITTSNALDDSGTFELNFQDEHYLPFEGAGAVSSWKLALPSVLRPFDYDTISDVIIHISYISKDDDDTFRTKVESEIVQALTDYATSEGLYRVISLKHEFPNAFHKLLHPSDGTQSTEFDLEKKCLSYFLKDFDLNILSAKTYLESKTKDRIDTTELTLKINSKTTQDWNDFGRNMKEGTVDLSGDPIRKWTIDAGENGLNEQELNDILILIEYTLA